MSLSPCRPPRGFSVRSVSPAPSRGRGRGSGFSSRSLGSFGGCRGGSRGRAWGSRARLGLQFGQGNGGAGLSPCPSGGIREVTVNQNLLAPVKVDIDPQFQAVRTQETQEIRALNNQFASFIDKVRFLEQQNQVLETKWELLQQLGESDGPRDLGPVFEAYLAQLRRQLEQVQRERGALDAELKNCQDQEEEYKAKYQEEARLHATTENDFVLLKKDVDGVFLSKMELDGQLEALRVHVSFLKHLYEEELGQLQTQGNDMSVVLSMDNNRSLDLSGVIAEVRARYEDIARTSKAEAQALYQSKYQELQTSVQLRGDDMKAVKAQISQLHCAIQGLQNQIENLKKQNNNLQSAITDAEQRGELALKDAQAKLDGLEGALRSTKQELARLLRDYQELMSVKLALDVEIATYRRLLEGEESRLSGECTSQVTVSVVEGSAVAVPVGTGGGLAGTCGFAGGQGSSVVVPGGVGGGLAGTCGFGGRQGSSGAGCSSIVTGGSSVTLGSGQGPAVGSCSVTGSGFSSSSGFSSGSGSHTIVKKTVESSLKTSVTY